MKRKIINQFEYDGLGFPVILLNVPICTVRGIETPEINYQVLQKNVLLALCHKPSPLTGNEIRFIRQYLEMTFINFAKCLGVTHPTVLHWEKSKNTFAKMTPSTEGILRLYVMDFLKANNRAFRDIFKEFNFSEWSKRSKKKVKNTINEFIKVDTNLCL